MPSIILKSLAVVALVAASAPALAVQSGSPEKTVLRYDAKTRKYCVTESAVTGSHLRKETCMTVAQWSAAGLDMPKPLIVAQK